MKKGILIILGFALLFGCYQNDDYNVFNVVKLKTELANKFEIDLDSLVAPLEGEYTDELIVDSILGKIPFRIDDDNYLGEIYSSDDITILNGEDSLSRDDIGLKLVEVLLSTVEIHNVKDDDIRRKFKETNAKDFYNGDVFNTLYFNTMILDLYEVESLTTYELHCLLIIRFILIELDRGKG